MPLIDAHVHAARRPTLKESWTEWAARFGKNVPLDELYDDVYKLGKRITKSVALLFFGLGGYREEGQVA